MIEHTLTPVYRRAWFAWLALAALVAWGLAGLAQHAENRVHLVTECVGESCRVWVNPESRRPAAGDALLSFTNSSPGAGLGLYAFAGQWERGGQAIRWLGALPLAKGNESPGPPVEAERVSFHQRRGRESLDLEPGTAWVSGAHGMGYQGEPGSRGVALLRGFEARDFRLEAELHRPEDLGFLVRAEGPQSGVLIAVRSRYNDVLVSDLSAGEPGPVLALAPLVPLRAGREGLRLAGLSAEIVLAALAIVALAGLASRRRLDVPGSGDPAVGSRTAVVVALVLFLATVSAHAGIAWFGLGRVPHIADESAYIFQARIFAGGRAWAPVPALPEFFQHEHVIMAEGKWFAKYPPLYPLILSIGMRLGVPWLVNPILGGLTGLAVMLLGWRIAGWRAGVLAWLLLLTSPFFLILGAGYMSHMTAALFLILALLAALRGLQSPRPVVAGLACGVGLGLAFLARPFTAALGGVALAAWLGLHLVHPAWRRRVMICGMLTLAAAAPFIGAFTAWNSGLLTEGSNPYAAYDGADVLGFGEDKGRGWLMTWGSWGHTPAKALRSIHSYLDHTSGHILGWPLRLGMALPLAGLLVWRDPRRSRWLLAFLPLALAAGHAFYWATQHLGYGARYWFSGAPLLVLLAALALLRLWPEPGRGRGLAGGILAALVIWNLVVYLPPRLKELPDYGAQTDNLARLAGSGALQRGLVFVATQGLLYNDGFHLNDPFLRSSLLFARDLGPRNQELRARYAELPAYRWDGRELMPLPDVPGDVR